MTFPLTGEPDWAPFDPQDASETVVSLSPAHTGSRESAGVSETANTAETGPEAEDAITFRRYAQPGGDFILDAPNAPEPVWGQGSEVLWSRQESLIVTGSIGGGKTSLTGNLVRASLGLDTHVLGYPVTPCRKVLYLAVDRPAQIARNLRRRFTEAERGLLNERLIVWRGPLPHDVVRDRGVVRRLAESHGLTDGDRIFVDSLKDVAQPLTDNEVGAAVTHAFGLCLRDGIDVLANHHQRKQQAGSAAGKPKGLADVYGSTWIGAGAGTVLLLWADEPGSPYVELSTLKPAAEPVGPLSVFHDIDAGTLTAKEQVSIEDYLRANPQKAHSTAQVCRAFGWDSAAGSSERAKALRVLRRLVRQGLVEETAHDRPEGGRPEAHFHWTGGGPDADRQGQ